MTYAIKIGVRAYSCQHKMAELAGWLLTVRTLARVPRPLLTEGPLPLSLALAKRWWDSGFY